MRRFPIRWGLFAAAVLTFSVGTVAVFPPEAAQAATIGANSTTGGPVNVLPSAVQSATSKYANYSQAEIMAAYLYSASKSPAFWDEVKRYNESKQLALTAGKPAPALPATIKSAKVQYPVASNLKSMSKLGGAVAGGLNVLTLLPMSIQSANGTLQMFGWDTEGQVCASSTQSLFNQALADLDQMDCSAYSEVPADFEPNIDATGEYTMKPVRDSAGHNVAYEGIWTAPANANVKYSCFSLSENTRQDNGVQIWIKAPNFTADTRMNFGPKNSFGSSSLGGAICSGIGSDDGQSVLVGYLSDGWGIPIKGMSMDGKTFSDGAEGSADPDRTLKCVVAATDGKEYSDVSDTFKESAGVLPDVKCPDLPEGVTADTIKIIETGGDTGDQTIWESEADPEVKKALTEHPECSSESTCPLVLYKDGESCFDSADCTGWSKDADQSRYTCKYGTASVSVADECSIYKNRWEPEAQKSGNTLSNPKTGTPLPNPKPELQPGTSANVGASPLAPELGKYDCWPSGWGALSPLSWVLQPLKCAFVPRPGSVEAGMKSIEQKTKGTMPATMISLVDGWDFKTPQTNCNGLPLRFQSPQPNLVPFDTGTVYIGAACTGVMASVALDTRIIFDFACIITALFSIGFYIARSFGWEGLGGSS